MWYHNNTLFLKSFIKKNCNFFVAADFLQLLFASLQLTVFKIEQNPEKMAAYGGGDNDCDIEKMDRMVPQQTNDFIAKKT